MIPPGVKRIIDIDVTNRCDLFNCSNCTRGLIYQQKRVDMTPENFGIATESLAEWSEQPPTPNLKLPGASHHVIAMIGGNPTFHPQFEELCKIFQKNVRKKEARGLWTNNLNGYGTLIRETFGFFNLNVHGVETAADEMRRDLPGVNIYGSGKHIKHSIHSGVFTAIQDFVGSAQIPDEEKMWDIIQQCDFNVKWSGSIVQLAGDGKIYAYFCEMAATYESIYGHKTGIPVTRDWWRLPIESFNEQVKEWCPKCGVPLRIRGHADNERTDDFSKTHQPLVQIGIKRKQKIEMHETLPDDYTHEATDYQQLRKPKQKA